MFNLTLIFVGAGLGGIARHLLALGIRALNDTPFPLGILAVNTLGCLAVGFFAAALTGPTWGDERYRLAIIVGFLGGFTTFSAFGLETVALLTERQFLLAALNVILSNTLGLAGVWLGLTLAKRLVTA